MYRSATSASVGPVADDDAEPFRAGASPALMLAITTAALRRACSADTSPCRPIVTRRDFPPCRVCTSYTLAPDGYTLTPKPESSRSQNTASRSPTGSPSTVRLEIVPLFSLAIVRFLLLRYSGRMSAPMLCATLAVDACTESRAR